MNLHTLKQIIAGLICLQLVNCSAPAKEYVLKAKLQKLDESTMYDSDMAYDVIFDSEEQNIDSLRNKSRTLFLSGIDLFKNKNNPAAAIPKFKAAILVFPDAKAYYELGNALMESKGGVAARDEAFRAFEVAGYLNFQPAASIMYKQACLSYQEYLYAAEDDKLRHLYNSVYYLKNAFMDGVADTTTVQRDPLINGIRYTSKYREMLTEIMAVQSKGDPNRLFGLYKGAFTRNASKFNVLPEDVAMESSREFISYDFAPFIPEMENTQFGRGVSNDYFYVGKVKETDKYVALLYASVSFVDEDMQPVYTTLAVYDHSGKLLSKKMVACQCSAEKIKRCSIDNGTIIVEDYKRQWEKPIYKVAFEDNKISGHELLAKAVYRIDDNGLIQADNVPAGYSDSTIFAQNK
jgi:tetratricopeptide (TPR) repeat protein